MGKQCILIANESLARIFCRVSTGEPLLSLHTIDFPEGRLFPCASPSTSSVQNAGSSERSSQQFVRELAEYLHSALTDEKYDALWIAASNPLLEALQARLSQNVTDKLKWTHQEDWTSLSTYSLELKLRDLRWMQSGSSLRNSTHCGKQFDPG